MINLLFILFCFALLASNATSVTSPGTPDHQPRVDDEGKQVYRAGAKSEGIGDLVVRGNSRRLQGYISLAGGNELGPFPLNTLYLVTPRQPNEQRAPRPRSKTPPRSRSSNDILPTKRFRSDDTSSPTSAFQHLVKTYHVQFYQCYLNKV